GPPEPPCALLPGLRDVGPLVVPDPPRGVLRLVLEPPRKAPERGDRPGRAPGPPLLGRGEPVFLQERRRDLRGLREEHAAMQMGDAPPLPLRQPLATHHASSLEPHQEPPPCCGPVRSRRRQISNRQRECEPQTVQLVPIDA